MNLTRRQFITTTAAATAIGALLLVARESRPSQFKVTMTTLFWVGEPASPDNSFIGNHQSYWDKDWQENFGGVDDPQRRNRYWPRGFKPAENPFYVALPYGEFVRGYRLKREAQRIPWYGPDISPLLKNHWVEVRWRGRSCYAQWEDVGPFGEDDFDFVFGDAKNPRNTFGAKAGLDLSPAVWHYLGMRENGPTAWRFVDAADVADGPWREIITTAGNNRYYQDKSASSAHLTVPRRYSVRRPSQLSGRNAQCG